MSTKTKKKKKAVPKKAPKKRKYHKDLKKAQADAEQAAGDAVAIMKLDDSDEDEDDDGDDDTKHKKKKKRMILRNQDYEKGLTDLTQKMAANGKVTASLADTIKEAMATKGNGKANSLLDKAAKIDERLSHARDEKRKMIAAGDSQEEIDEMTEQIKQYAQLKKTVDKQVFMLWQRSRYGSALLLLCRDNV